MDTGDVDSMGDIGVGNIGVGDVGGVDMDCPVCARVKSKLP